MRTDSAAGAIGVVHGVAVVFVVASLLALVADPGALHAGSTCVECAELSPDVVAKMEVGVTGGVLVVVGAAGAFLVRGGRCE